MGKKFSKILAVVLTLCMVATFCVVPMTASAETPANETYDTVDEITLSDLGLTPGNFTNTLPEAGSTYTAKSSSYSYVLKFYWSANLTPESGEEWCVSPDGQYNHGKGLWIRGANFLFCYPSDAQNVLSAINSGDHLVEFGRKKVLSGENQGKYYVYVAVDDTMLADGYLAYENPNNTIWIRGGALANQRFADYAEQETYEAYDEVYYSQLKLNGATVATETTLGGVYTYKYNRTSPTGSAIFKYRWTVGSGMEQQVSIGKAPGGLSYVFGAWIRPADETHANGRAWIIGGPENNSPIAIVAGNSYDIEIGRLKVKTGSRKGQYYVYYKIDGKMAVETYVAANVVDSNGNYTDINGNVLCSVLSGEIFISGNGDKISETTYEQQYEDYDEVYYSQLKLGGAAVGTETTLGGVYTYKYNRTSPTGSAIFKYRWTVGSGREQQVSIGKAPNGLSYVFGAWIRPADSDHANGRAWIIGGPENNSPVAIVAGNSYGIEIARLKVKNGPRKGQYYVYYKIDGKMAVETYVAANVVDANGNYTDINGNVLCSVLSGEIFISGNGDKISEVDYEQEYEKYDEIGYSDLKDKNGDSLSPSGTEMYGATLLNYVPASPTGSAILKYRWTVGSVPKFQLSFGECQDGVAYPFCAWMDQESPDTYTNGRMWLCPGNSLGSPATNCAFALATGSTYNVEFARLKVKNGPNKGRYHVYIKIDDVLFNEVYVAADVVDADGNYHDYRNINDNVLSGKIILAFHETNNNIISDYKENHNGHLGVRGDLDDGGIINANDLVILRKILLGTEDISEMPEGIADFNNDGTVDILDLIAMKKYLAPVNTYAKSGSLVLGTQEHLLESNGVGFVDNTKTAEYIADASVALGAKSYRLSMSIATLFYPTSTNEVMINTENMAKFKGQIAALKDAGIDDILYVTDAFLLPYSYHSDGTPCHNLTVPNPKTEKVKYENWLKVNANAFKKLAEECPEIKFFEPGNELNLTGVRLEKPGIDWSATETQQAAYKYTVNEKASIVADLCWNVSNAVKSVNPANQVTTPSISVQESGSVQSKFTDELYKAIESGAYPTNQTLGDKRIDNYFTILNIHIYPLYKTESSNITTFANQVNTFYNVVKQHNDGGSRVWITETGLSGVNGYRDESTVASIFGNTLNKINTGLAFVDTVFVYKLADVSTDFGLGDQETYYGLFYSGDDNFAPYAAKPIAKTVYSFFNNGSTNYAALDALVTKYDK